MIYLENRRKKEKTLRDKYPDAVIIDLTSKGAHPFVKFSPFYPHGNIPVPFSVGVTAQTVEGIWQGLKVFEKEDVDPSKFEIENMRGIKRTVRKFGKPKGHRRGVEGTELLNYAQARKEIYLPAYRRVLKNHCWDLLLALTLIAEQVDIVFLDYTTNEDIEDLKKPLSHAALVKLAVEHLLNRVEKPASDPENRQLNLFNS